MTFPALRFVFLLTLWVVVCIGLAAVFYGPHSGVVESFFTGAEKLERIAFLFRHADDWNWIALTFFLASSIVVFAVNDILVRRLIEKVKILPKSLPFWVGGFFWIARVLSDLFLFAIELGVVAYLLTITVSSPYIYQVGDISPDSRYHLLVLGTSKYLVNSKSENRYYTERISTAAQLFKKGVVRKVVVSGDKKRDSDYDETRDMREDLIRRGFPAAKILMDTAGHRTFDSIGRLLAYVDAGEDTVCIISQAFHLERALFLAKQSGIRAIGVVAQGGMTKSMLQREFFAKPRILFDYYIFNTQATGIKPFKRRSIDVRNPGDAAILLFVILVVSCAGLLTRSLLYY
jgi:vancomycin permeability regulator SanA